MLQRKGTSRLQTLEELEYVRAAYTRSPSKSICWASTQLLIPHFNIHKLLHKSFGLWTYPRVLCSYNMPLCLGLAATKELAVSMLETLNSDVGFLKRDCFSGWSTRRGALIVAIIIYGHLVLYDVT